MQWQLIPDSTMHAFNINVLLAWSWSTNLRIGPEKIPETDTIFFFQCKNDQCGSKNTHAAVPEKLTINFCWPKTYVLLATKDWEIIWLSNILKFIPETHHARLCFYLHCTIFIADNQNREGDVKQPSWRECHYFKHRFTCPDHLPQSQQGYRLQSPSYHHDPFT